MGLPPGGGAPNLQPVSPQGVPRAPVPYYLDIEPVAVVAAGATVTQMLTVGPRNFVCCGFGFTSAAVGVPPVGQLFRLGIRDIGASIRFQPARFHATPVVGSNPATADKAYVEFPEMENGRRVTWRFARQTTIEIEFENIGAIACLPTIVLVGYLE